MSYPVAYIAAPFTGKAEVDESVRQEASLFDMPQLHGLISVGHYRRALTRICQVLKQMGIASILPHRDVNEWGKKKLTPNLVMQLCSRQVALCDVFIGILGESHGAHYEFGLAMGMKKPSVLVQCADIQSSFVAAGVNGLGLLADNVLTVQCDSLRSIPQCIDSEPVRAFLRRYFPVCPRQVQQKRDSSIGGSS
jgi:hypothetical protein